MRVPRLLLLLALTTSCMFAACATAAKSASGGGNGSTLTQAQLEKATSENLYDALVKLRPAWLSSRGPTSITNSSPTSVDVFMDGNIVGTADFLRELRVTDVSLVRYWSAGEASARFGMGHPRGVIEVTRK